MDLVHLKTWRLSFSMKKHNLTEFTKGWFIGDFTPSLLPTKDFEISIKRYKSGSKEMTHHHKIATEYTVIISGRVEMNSIIFQENDIIEISPGESADFKVLEDTITCVVKLPSVKDDKYLD